MDLAHCTDEAAAAVATDTHGHSLEAVLLPDWPADVVTALCDQSAQVRGAADLDVDILLLDVDGVLPELYQVVEVVFMGNSTYTTTSNGEQLEPESVLLCCLCRLLFLVVAVLLMMVQKWPL